MPHFISEDADSRMVQYEIYDSMDLSLVNPDFTEILKNKIPALV